eukprot:m.75725 g.75725  ORF g.75725 m.75725 type:complete len:72 (-) comp24819_c0_seq1:255-470(-)
MSRYIITAEKDQLDSVITDFVAFVGGTQPADFKRLNIINGFASTMTAEAKTFLEAHAGVKAIEADGVVSAN